MNVINFREGRGLIYQTDIELRAPLPAMHDAGCFSMVIIESLTCHFGLPFTHGKVIEFIKEQFGDGETDIDSRMYIGGIQNFIDDLVGRFRVKILDTRRDPNYECREDEWDWSWWHRDGTDFNHATHANGQGLVLYDPWGQGGSRSVRDGYRVYKAIARLVG